MEDISLIVLTNRLTVSMRAMTPAKLLPLNHWLRMVSWTMTTVPLPMPYMTRPTIMVVKLVLCIERATKILPRVIKTVVRIEPDTVPKASRYKPPSTGKTVLTMETLD